MWQDLPGAQKFLDKLPADYTMSPQIPLLHTQTWQWERQQMYVYASSSMPTIGAECVAPILVSLVFYGIVLDADALLGQAGY